jgi:glutamine---fructose-6-phosphate transaminase (isomerizing)
MDWTSSKDNPVIRAIREVSSPSANTIPQEKASTHTISYSTALTVLAQLVAGYVGDAGAPLLEALAEAPSAMRATLEMPLDDAVVETLVAPTATPGIIAGTGLDAITADEVALKIKEGTYLWFEGMHTEVTLHGTPAVFRPGMAAIVIEPGVPDGGRTVDLLNFLDRLGAKATIWAAAYFFG